MGIVCDDLRLRDGTFFCLDWRVYRNETQLRRHSFKRKNARVSRSRAKMSSFRDR